MNNTTHETLSLDFVKTLAQEKGPTLSFYLPLHAEKIHQKEDHIRSHNLLREAKQLLLESDLDEAMVKKFLQLAETFFKDLAPGKREEKGMALFISSHLLHSVRLPFSVDEKVVYSKNFYLRPLFKEILSEDRFFLLALSQKSVRLFRGDQHHLTDVSPLTFPQILADVGQEHSQKHHGYHSVSASRGSHSAIHHGLGEGVDNVKGDILRYFRAIDKSLHELFKMERAPLILAGVEFLRPLYREVNHYSHLWNTGIFGEPDGFTDQELHQRAWEIINLHMGRAEDDALAKYASAAGSGRVSNKFNEIIPAALQGKIETLFIPEQIQNAEIEEMLNQAALHTLLHRGKVYLVSPEKIPQRHNAAAIIRY